MEGYSKNNLKAFSENQLNDHETLEILFGNSFYFQYFKLIYKHLWKQFENRLMYKNRELTMWIMLNTKNSKQLKRITTVMRQSVFIREKTNFMWNTGKLRWKVINIAIFVKDTAKKMFKTMINRW